MMFIQIYSFRKEKRGLYRVKEYLKDYTLDAKFYIHQQYQVERCKWRKCLTDEANSE